MGRTITQVVALGVLPVWLAVLAYLAATELLSWPLFGAKLSAVVVCLLVLGIGNRLSQGFLDVGHRKRQPHEVGRFLVRLTSLHTLSALTAAGSYLLIRFWTGHSYPWLCWSGAAIGGTLSYVMSLWILFAAKDQHRAGRHMLSEAELDLAAKQLGGCPGRS